MEDEVCKFGKFGFCKFKDRCRRKHYTDICERLLGCRNTTECQKRHPKECNRHFTSENKCWFKKDCAYSHSKINHDEEKNKFKKNVDNLEKTVNELDSKVESKKVERYEKVLHALTWKVLYLENEIKEIRNNSDSVYEVLNENCDTEESSFNHIDIKHSSSTPKVVKEKEID